MTPETAVERAVLAEMRLKHITEAFECYINATTTPLNGYDERREPRLASQEAITDARIAVESLREGAMSPNTPENRAILERRDEIDNLTAKREPRVFINTVNGWRLCSAVWVGKRFAATYCKEGGFAVTHRATGAAVMYFRGNHKAIEAAKEIDSFHSPCVSKNYPNGTPGLFRRVHEIEVRLGASVISNPPKRAAR